MWSELRRRSHIDLAWSYLSGCDGRIEDLGGGTRRITLDPRLDRPGRRATLAHELIHDERELFFDDSTPIGIVRKEEAYVEAEAVRRLVPLDELEQLVRGRVSDDGTVECHDVMEWFEVPEDVAVHAINQLKQKRPQRWHPSSGRPRPR